MELSRDGFATVDVASGTVKGADGKIGQWIIPADALSATGTYSWRVRVKSATAVEWSAWSTPQAFDFALPPPPVVPVVPHSAERTNS